MVEDERDPPVAKVGSVGGTHQTSRCACKAGCHIAIQKGSRSGDGRRILEHDLFALSHALDLQDGKPLGNETAWKRQEAAD
jgi:hypothetical protein